MKVSFAYREVPAQFGKGIDYFLDATVVLSQEERAIIESRRLHDSGFDVAGAVRPYEQGGNSLAMPLRIGAFVVGIGGFFLFFDIGMLFVLIGVGMFIISFFLDKAAKTASYGQRITFGLLMNDEKFTVFAPDPAAAKEWETIITGELQKLKEHLTQNVTLGESRTIEL